MAIQFEDDVFEKVIGDVYDSGGMECLQMLEEMLKKRRGFWTKKRTIKNIEYLRDAIVRSSFDRKHGISKHTPVTWMYDQENDPGDHMHSMRCFEYPICPAFKIKFRGVDFDGDTKLQF